MIIMGIKIFNAFRDGTRASTFGNRIDFRIICWPVTGANLLSFQCGIMPPGTCTREHFHGASEDVIFVVQGEGFVENKETSERFSIRKGNVVFVEPGTWHKIVSTGHEDLICVGSTSPPDYMFYKADEAISEVLSRYLLKRREI